MRTRRRDLVEPRTNPIEHPDIIRRILPDEGSGAGTSGFVVPFELRRGETRKHRGTLRSLGLGRIGASADHALGPELEGKLRHVAHLVSVEQLAGKDKD